MRFAAIALLQASLLAVACSQPATPDAGQGDAAADTTPAIRIGDETVTIGELDEWIKNQLFDQETESGKTSKLYEVRAGAAENLVAQRLLEAEAKRLGTTSDALIEAEVKKRVAVDDAEVQRFYDENKKSFGERAIARLRRSVPLRRRARSQPARRVRVRRPLLPGRLAGAARAARALRGAAAPPPRHRARGGRPAPGAPERLHRRHRGDAGPLHPRRLSARGAMVEAGSDPVREGLERYVGAPMGPPILAPDPVNLPMIRHWVDALDDRNPVYLDEELAATTRFGGIVAPPAMLQTWSMPRPKIEGIAQRGGAPDEMRSDNPIAALDRAGFVGTLATNSELEFVRYLRPGDRLSARNEVESISERRPPPSGRDTS